MTRPSISVRRVHEAPSSGRPISGQGCAVALCGRAATAMAPPINRIVAKALCSPNHLGLGGVILPFA